MPQDPLFERLWDGSAQMEEWTAAVSQGAITSLADNIITVTRPISAAASQQSARLTGWCLSIRPIGQPRESSVCHHHRCIRTATWYREYQSLMQLLKFLRCRGECSAAPVKTTATDDLVARYGQHLNDYQGLATITIERYRTVAKRFLHERFGCGVVDLRALGAGDVIAFVQRQTKFMQPRALK